MPTLTPVQRGVLGGALLGAVCSIITYLYMPDLISDDNAKTGHANIEIAMANVFINCAVYGLEFGVTMTAGGFMGKAAEDGGAWLTVLSCGLFGSSIQTSNDSDTASTAPLLENSSSAIQ